MLVALTGPQGGGKSTLTEYFQNLGFPIITRKTARSILGEWDKTLHDVNNDFGLSLKFQEEVIKRKHEDEMEAITDKDRIWFIERSFTDVFAYTLVNFGKNNEYNEWLNDYYVRCKEYQKYYTAVIYIPGGFFPIREDGVRGINQHYGKMIDLVMDHYVRKMTLPKRLHFLDKMDINERVQDIGNFVKCIAQNDPKIYEG
jgi:predicted ATPase